MTKENWIPPNVDPDNITKGDMPGDKIEINESHISRANVIFRHLINNTDICSKKREVISVFGGSGVGKSEVGSILAFYFKEFGLKSYVLSGDNYPYRIPEENDKKREEIFNEGGRDALEEYLGTNNEIEFSNINKIIQLFKSGKNEITLKRMGRTLDSIFYEKVDFSEIDILVVEWTHGNNKNLVGVDYPIFLYSTPEETLKHRLSRARDKGADSDFTTLVLDIEQDLLNKQGMGAELIVSLSGEIIPKKKFYHWRQGVMLNIYPDSCGGSLENLNRLLSRDEFSDMFSSVYILPSMFKSDLDRGFSVISYDLNSDFAKQSDLDFLKSKNISLKLDFVLNHLSINSPQFMDMLKNGENSKFKDFFIDWNKFWDGKGELSEDGYIIPESSYLDKLFMRKPGLPILKVPFPDGSNRFYWNTFYNQKILKPLSPNQIKELKLSPNEEQIVVEKINKAITNKINFDSIEFDLPRGNEIKSYLERNNIDYLGQMDLNAESETTWDFYNETFKKLGNYGGEIVRLDAFAYLHKEIGYSNFFNEPGTWEYLERIKGFADDQNITLLPEIHSRHQEGIHKKIAEKGYPIYDFFFPGLLIYTIEKGSNTKLISWINEIVENNYNTVNMLGCHDGIPLLDVKGLLSDNEIDDLMNIVKNRGGRVKDLYGPDGKKIAYYQINATFYSALGEDDKKLLLARAIQIFMPGKPQVWYLDLFAGKNDYVAADTIGHKDINRTNLSIKNIDEQLKLEVVKEQLKLLRLRNNNPVFGKEAKITIFDTPENQLKIMWSNGKKSLTLDANLDNLSFKIE